MLCEEIKHKFQEMHAGDQKNDFQRIFESENWSKKCHAKKKHVLILYPNDPILVLKWRNGPFCIIINFWNLTLYFRFGGIPGFQEIMISKNFLRKIYLLRHFSIFFDGTGLKMTGKRSARNCRSPIWRFLTF